MPPGSRHIPADEDRPALAAHLLRLLVEDRFPVIWLPDSCVRDLRALVAHRMRLVRMRTMVKNGLHAIALNYWLGTGRAVHASRPGATAGVSAAGTLPVARRESLEPLSWLDAHINP